MTELYCDMDGVLVNQTGRARFDLMDWMPDGRELWMFIAPYRPTILSQLMMDIWEVSRHEKRIWVERELGADVPVIVVHAEEGKHPHSGPGAVLIDDSLAHQEPWESKGGVFVHHITAERSIEQLRQLLR